MKVQLLRESFSSVLYDKIPDEITDKLIITKGKELKVYFSVIPNVFGDFPQKRITAETIKPVFICDKRGNPVDKRPSKYRIMIYLSDNRKTCMTNTQFSVVIRENFTEDGDIRYCEHFHDLDSAIKDFNRMVKKMDKIVDIDSTQVTYDRLEDVFIFDR